MFGLTTTGMFLMGHSVRKLENYCIQETGLTEFVLMEHKGAMWYCHDRTCVFNKKTVNILFCLNYPSENILINFFKDLINKV